MHKKASSWKAQLQIPSEPVFYSILPGFFFEISLIAAHLGGSVPYLYSLQLQTLEID